ncbi:MAG: SMI1/KNR4 family protein [Chloroflexota bacterium]|nr:SMI1/KNR4 family protein [Chloroflexota bacterium]MDQ5865935.1 SMI1/KNR4 family protein [Chloroflexota bacterium]
MQLVDVTYEGPPNDDSGLLDPLPPDLRNLLEQINGFIQFGGGLHVRGACVEPVWHSIGEAMTGEFALHEHYPNVLPTDVPFAQDAIGDQYVLRDGVVHWLYAETGDLESLRTGLIEFLEAAQANPDQYLGLQLLRQFLSSGGTLQPGELLHVYPPLCTVEARSGVSVTAVPAAVRLAFLRQFAEQVRGASEGGQIEMKVEE